MHPTKEELSGFLLGKLAPDATESVAKHIDECPPCQETILDLDGDQDTLLQRLQQSPPAALDPNVKQIVAKVAALAKSPSRSSSQSEPDASSPTIAPVGGQGPTRDQFLAALRAAQILEPDELAAALQRPAAAGAGDGAALARALVENGALSKFQAMLVYQNKPRGLLFGDYVVIDRLGAGGMGQVFKARHRRMKRIVALKVLAKSALNSPDAVKRFQREAEAAAKLIHSNIVTAFDAGQQDGVHYLVMEYVEGSDLSQLVKNHGPLAIDQAIEYVMQTARGLEFAHKKGVVHRDIKPANLLVDAEGTVKILDMGLARIDDAMGGGAGIQEGLTQSGQVMGTVDYMAPEQAVDTRTADAKADVYALGCTLHRLLTGENVYSGETLVQKLLAHREQPIPSLRARRADVSAAVDDVFRRMIAKRPEDRLQSMTLVIEALEAARRVPVTPGPEADSRLTSFLQNFDPSSPLSLKPTTPSARSTQPLGENTAAPAPLLVEVSPNPTTATGPSVQALAAGRQPAAVTAEATASDGAGRKPPSRKLIAAGAAGFVLIALGVWFIIRDKDGNEIARVQAPDGSSVQVITPVPPTATNAVLPNQTPTASPSGAAAPSVPPLKVLNITPPPAPTATATFIATKSPTFISPQPTGPTPSLTTNLNQAIAVVSPHWSMTEGISLVFPDRIQKIAPRESGIIQVLGNEVYHLGISVSSGKIRQYKLDGTIVRTINISQPEKYGGCLGFVILPNDRFALLSNSQDRIFILDSSGNLIQDLAWPPTSSGSQNCHGIVWKNSLYAVNYGILLEIKLDDLSTVEHSLPNLGDYGLAVLGDRLFIANKNDLSTWSGSGPAEPFWKQSNEFLPGEFICNIAADGDTLLLGMCRGKSGAEERGRILRFDPRSKTITPVLDLNFGVRHIAAVQKGIGHSVTGTRTSPPPAVAPFDAAQARAHQEAWAEYLGTTVETTNSVGMKMALIPPGEFLMGSTDEQIEAAVSGTNTAEGTKSIVRKSERPQHRVTLTKPFLMGTTEVTLGQFKKFTAATGFLTVAEKVENPPSRSTYLNSGNTAGDEAPVVNLTWTDAAAFCDWLSAQEKTAYRMPTEAEWEFACRAGTTTQFYFGDDPTDLAKHAWYSGAQPKVGQLVVAAKLSNPFGLYDMYGSVWESCQDWFGGEGYSPLATIDPQNVASRSTLWRTTRGGGSSSQAIDCRSAKRGGGIPTTNRNAFTGFRIVRTVDLPPPVAPTTPAATGPALPTVAIGPTLVITDDTGKLTEIGLKSGGFEPISQNTSRGIACLLTTTKPDEVKREPSRNGVEHRYYGDLRIGRDVDPRYFYCLDHDQLGTAVLWFDHNKNGDLTDDGDPVKKSPDKNVTIAADQFQSLGAKLSFPWEKVVGTNDFPGTYDIWLFSDVRRTIKNPAMLHYGRIMLRGSVTLDGKQYAVFWSEADGKVDGDMTNDRIAIDLNGNGKINAGEEPKIDWNLGGKTYRFQFKPASASVTSDVVVNSPPPAVAPFDAAQARAHQEAWAKHLGTTVETTNSVGAKMVFIPPGEFLMGSTDEQVEAVSRMASDEKASTGFITQLQKTERPQHRTVIAQPFLIGATEVTVAQFRKFAEATKHVTEAEQYGFGNYHTTTLNEKVREIDHGKNWRSPGYVVTEDLPVTQVTWNDAVAYCKWLSTQENAAYRLSTEAEWEYACRAGTTTLYSFGDDPTILGQFAWFNKNTGAVHSVGTKLPNAFGLHDMHGNVYEWCHDFFDEDWYKKASPDDSSGPLSGYYHAIRSGSYVNRDYNCRSAYRYGYAASLRMYSYGFRVVCEIATSTSASTVEPVNAGGKPKKSALAFEDPVFGAWMKIVAALPAEQQIEAVSKKLMELNPGFDGKLTGVDGKDSPKIVDGVVTELAFVTANVTDLSPVRALVGLKGLSCNGISGRAGVLSDLSPLQGMTLTSLRCYYTQISDLSPLQGMPLTLLYCGYSQVSDLSPLAGMPLTNVNLIQTQVSDLSPLKGMQLFFLSIAFTQVSDLSPLRGMPLSTLHCNSMPISDFSALEDCKKLGTLALKNSKVTAMGVAALQKALPNCKISWDETAAPQLPTATDK